MYVCIKNQIVGIWSVFIFKREEPFCLSRGVIPSCQEGPLCVSALGDSSVPNTECAGSCKQLERLMRDPFWSCSCCLQQAFTQVQSARQASTVKQQLLLQQLWREMQVCGVLGKPVLSPALTVLAPEVKEKHSMFSVHTRTHKRNHHRGLWWFRYFDWPERERKMKMMWWSTLGKLCTALHRDKPFLWGKEGQQSKTGLLITSYYIVTMSWKLRDAGSVQQIYVQQIQVLKFSFFMNTVSARESAVLQAYAQSEWPRAFEG